MQNGQRERTVLVVEDEFLVLMMASDMLQEAGYTTLEARDAVEAMSILEINPDVYAVFTDIDMPGNLNGLDLSAAVSERWPHIKVVVTSGRERPTDRMPLTATFIEKPYVLRDLMTALICTGSSS